MRLSAPEKAEAEVLLAAEKDTNFGGGLWLRKPRGLAKSFYWSFRYTSPAGVRRDTSLGTVLRSNLAEAAESLSRARVEVARNRELLRQAIDPIEQNKAEKGRARNALQVAKAEVQREGRTLARVSRDYHGRIIEGSRSDKHARQWLQALETHVPPEIWHAPVTTVTAPALLGFLEQLQKQIPETSSRVRQRLDAVLEDAHFHGWIDANPAAALKRKLREATKGNKRKRGHFAYLKPGQAPAFMAELRKREGIAARALEFGVLCACRTREILGLRWEELDLAKRQWVVPGARMKAGEPHTVYLSARAVQIVESMRYLAQPYVFPSPALDGTPLSNMALLSLLRRMDAAGQTTVHGLCRATFSTWANEQDHKADVIEAALAHRESGVRAAYKHSEYVDKRRALSDAWAVFLCPAEPLAAEPVPNNVVAIRPAA